MGFNHNITANHFQNDFLNLTYIFEPSNETGPVPHTWYGMKREKIWSFLSLREPTDWGAAI